jgi:hypothetical protein
MFAMMPAILAGMPTVYSPCLNVCWPGFLGPLNLQSLLPVHLPLALALEGGTGASCLLVWHDFLVCSQDLGSLFGQLLGPTVVP